MADQFVRPQHFQQKFDLRELCVDAHLFALHLHFNLRGRFAATTMIEAGGVRNLTGGGLA